MVVKREKVHGALRHYLQFYIHSNRPLFSSIPFPFFFRVTAVLNRDIGVFFSNLVQYISIRIVVILFQWRVYIRISYKRLYYSGAVYMFSETHPT